MIPSGHAQRPAGQLDYIVMPPDQYASQASLHVRFAGKISVQQAQGARVSPAEARRSACAQRVSLSVHRSRAGPQQLRPTCQLKPAHAPAGLPACKHHFHSVKQGCLAHRVNTIHALSCNCESCLAHSRRWQAPDVMAQAAQSANYASASSCAHLQLAAPSARQLSATAMHCSGLACAPVKPYCMQRRRVRI